MFCHCFSCIFVCYHVNALTFMSFVSFETDIVGDSNDDDDDEDDDETFLWYG